MKKIRSNGFESTRVSKKLVYFFIVSTSSKSIYGNGFFLALIYSNKKRKSAIVTMEIFVC